MLYAHKPVVRSTCPALFLPPVQIWLSVILEHNYGYRDLVVLLITIRSRIVFPMEKIN